MQVKINIRLENCPEKIISTSVTSLVALQSKQQYRFIVCDGYMHENFVVSSNISRKNSTSRPRAVLDYQIKEIMQVERRKWRNF